MTNQNVDPWADHNPADTAIEAYASGGCPFCGARAEDYARYPAPRAHRPETRRRHAAAPPTLTPSAPAGPWRPCSR